MSKEKGFPKNPGAEYEEETADRFLAHGRYMFLTISVQENFYLWPFGQDSRIHTKSGNRLSGFMPVITDLSIGPNPQLMIINNTHNVPEQEGGTIPFFALFSSIWQSEPFPNVSEAKKT